MAKKYYIRFIVLVLFSICTQYSHAQRLGASTNVLGWCALSPNAKLELNLTQRSSISLEGSFSPFELKNGNKLCHVSIAPEYKYWFRQVMFAHYVGVMGRYASYSIAYDDKSWRGDFVALGLTYGYSFVINNRLNIVPNIGVGYGLRNDYYGTKAKFMPMLTNLGVNIQYIFRGKQR